MILVNLAVLAAPGPDLTTRSLHHMGIQLWKMLYEQTLGRVGIVIDDFVKPEILEHWLVTNGIKAAIYETLDTHDPELKAEKIHRLQGLHGKVTDWYFDVDARTCALTIQRGIPTMFVGIPYIVRPEWDSGQKVRAWDALVEEVDRQAYLKAKKTWGDGPTLDSE